MPDPYIPYQPRERKPTTHVYLDEAGGMDFYAKGRGGAPLKLGDKGVSRYFLLGILRVKGDAKVVNANFARFLQTLKSEPYFGGIQSHEERRSFQQYWVHANKDLPEIRMQVFEWLLKNPVEFSAVIYRKDHAHFEGRFARQERLLYAYLLSHLAKPYCATTDRVVFSVARLGGSTSEINLDTAFRDARKMYEREATLLTSAPDFRYDVQEQSRVLLLGAADYFGWAVQRAIEGKGELRFARKMKPQIRELAVVDPVDANFANVIRFTDIDGVVNHLNKKSPHVR